MFAGEADALSDDELRALDAEGVRMARFRYRDFCHLDGEHGGRIRVGGPADRPVWTLGRTPILRIEGRDKREVAAQLAPAR